MSTATVMLAGASGLGKSTLGNYLLIGSPDDGFSTAAGREAVTMTCEAREDRSQPDATLKVIDTPGTPCTRGDTAEYLDAIKEGARKAERLNALVYGIEYSQNRMYRLSDMENSAAFLRQFDELGCKMIIACRVPGHLLGGSTQRILRDEHTWQAFVTEIKRRAVVEDAATYLLEAADMAAKTSEMRGTIIDCPSVEVPDRGGLKAFCQRKLKHVLCARINCLWQNAFNPSLWHRGKGIENSDMW